MKNIGEEIGGLFYFHESDRETLSCLRYKVEPFLPLDASCMNAGGVTRKEARIMVIQKVDGGRLGKFYGMDASWVLIRHFG